MAYAMQRPTPWVAFAVGGLVAAFGVAAAFYAQPPLRRILIAVVMLVIVVTAVATPVANLTLPIPDLPEDFYR